MLTVLFWVSEVIIVALVIIPILRFLLYQWPVRRNEFVNRLRGQALGSYLHFYGQPTKNQTMNVATLDQLYNRLVGRHLYYVPTLVLFIVVTVLGGLVISTAIRSGYENYVVFYEQWLAEETHFGTGIALPHLKIDDLDKYLSPFPSIVLSLPSLAAIAGAYLYVVGVVIQGFRARTLVSSDLLWCSFRMVIAVPMGLSLGALALPALASFIGFSLGAFPIEAINRVLRRLLSKTLNVSEDETEDQLVKLSGVTPETSAVLAGEGISAVQQLASQDPVALAVRTGLAFDYILYLVARSQAWRTLGSTAGNLVPLGLGDALAIARLVERLDAVPPDSEAAAVLAAAAKKLELEQEVLKNAFRTIKTDPYTQFLLHVSGEALARQADSPRDT